VAPLGADVSPSVRGSSVVSASAGGTEDVEGAFVGMEFLEDDTTEAGFAVA
jgi:hypothetical protein